MVLKWTRTKPEPLKYFEQELNLNSNRYMKRFATLVRKQWNHIHKLQSVELELSMFTTYR